MCCISDPTVTVVYDMDVDMDLLQSLKQEGFSYEIVYDVIPSFGAPGEREFVVYKAHYGLATAMVAYDMVVLKTHEEKYDWATGIKTELLFLQTVGAIGYVDVDTISEVASWESNYGKNLFVIPESVEYILFSDDQYPVSQSMQTDYFYFRDGWIAVPGNATVSVEKNALTIVLMRCGGELSADTSRLPVFAPFRQVVLVCNSIDYELTGRELKNILEGKGYIVRRVYPNEFDVYRWFSPRIILLGGHQSPEGMGDIVATIITETEKKMIEKTEPYLFAHDDRDFKHQSIIILAGKDREGTREITLARIDNIVMWLESVM
jgi:hypothetical protein